ncbi:MAG TPA: hypothetical protein VFH56_17175 [Acidimicrobiales bacterium]|nr:hypothetical protein [Acidimicrobiales bacterium]
MKPIKVKINGARRPRQIVVELKSIDDAALLVERLSRGDGIIGEADVLAGARMASHLSGRP